MNSGIVTTMERGQVTIPKKIRDKLGISPGMPLAVELKDQGIMITPIVQSVQEERLPTGGFFILPKISQEEYKKRIRSITPGAWTKEDDKILAKLDKIEEKRLKKYDW